MENLIKLVEYSDSNSKTDKTTSMLSLRRTGLNIIYSIPLLFLKISHKNEIFYVLIIPCLCYPCYLQWKIQSNLWNILTLTVK